MRYIIGIDEVGRGPLAGPVVVAAVAVPVGYRVANKALGRLKDSKQLAPEKRRAWAHEIKKHASVRLAIRRAYPRAIEKLNISRAANLAAKRAFEAVCDDLGLGPNECRVFLDGGLFIGSRALQANYAEWNMRTVIKGDEKFAAIKMASIVAKVSRDRFMEKLSKEYPAYGFHIHKGYGTKLHRAAIKKHGPSAAHRKTFLK